MKTSAKEQEAQRIDEIRVLAAENERLRADAMIDESSGVHTLAFLSEFGSRETGRLRRFGSPLSLVLLEVAPTTDDPADAALHYRSIGGQLLVNAREVDVVASIGPQRFAVLMPNSGLSGALNFAERLRLTLDRAIPGAAPASISLAVVQAEVGEIWEEVCARGQEVLQLAIDQGCDRVAVGEPSQQAREGRVGGLVQLTWRAAYESGHPVIDRQHRTLFNLTNDLLTRAVSADDLVPLSLFAQIVDVCVAHFTDEERVLLEAGYPDLDGHRREHRRLIDRARRLQSGWSKSGLEPGELVIFLVRDIVAGHLLKDDVKHFSFIGTASR